jgi:DNA anti-recombination protein RmuC
MASFRCHKSRIRQIRRCRRRAFTLQLNTASNSVESLGRRTRAMSRKLKSVETLPNQEVAEKLLGLSTNDMLDGSVEEVGDGEVVSVAAK